MKPLFGRGPSILLRLCIAIIVAFFLILLDTGSERFVKVRSLLDTLITPVYSLGNAPRNMLDGLSDTFASRNALQRENNQLKKQILVSNSDLLLLEQLKQENNRLRELLGSPLRQDEHKMVSQVLSNGSDPYAGQIVLDKGEDDGVYKGQPVISEKGVVGQVVAVAKNTSRVLLVCDVSHALPVQVLRNDVRVIAGGNGCSDDLQLEYLPSHIDIREGDVLVTSGLGGRFPEGYPVGTVSTVREDSQRASMIVSVRPAVDLQRLRYLLLLWNDEATGKTPHKVLAPNEVHKTANERLKKMSPTSKN